MRGGLGLGLRFELPLPHGRGSVSFAWVSSFEWECVEFCRLVPKWYGFCCILRNN